MNQKFSDEMEREIKDVVNEFEQLFITVQTIDANVTREKWLESVKKTYDSTLIEVSGLQRANSGGHLDNDVLRIQILAMKRLLS